MAHGENHESAAFDRHEEINADREAFQKEISDAEKKLQSAANEEEAKNAQEELANIRRELAQFEKRQERM